MSNQSVLAELIYCAGWIAIGAAGIYSRRLQRRQVDLRRLRDRLQECAPLSSLQPTPAEPSGAPAFPGFAEDLAHLAAATGGSVPVTSGEEKTAVSSTR